MKNAKDLKIQAKSTALIGAIVSVPNTRPEKKMSGRRLLEVKLTLSNLPKLYQAILKMITYKLPV